MLCCKHYNEHDPFKHRKENRFLHGRKNRFKHGKKVFLPGDKICCRRNCRIGDIFKDESDSKGKVGEHSNCENGPEGEGCKKLEDKKPAAVSIDQSNPRDNQSNLTQITDSEIMADDMPKSPEKLTGEVHRSSRLRKRVTDDRKSDRGSIVGDKSANRSSDREEENTIRVSNGDIFKIISVSTVPIEYYQDSQAEQFA